MSYDQVKSLFTSALTTAEIKDNLNFAGKALMNPPHWKSILIWSIIWQYPIAYERKDVI